MSNFERGSENFPINVEGISFETPIGATYDHVNLDIRPEDKSVREAFEQRDDVKDALAKARKFREDFPGTFNGILLGNPKFSNIGDNQLDIQAERLHYHIYFAAHEMRKEGRSIGEDYAALSVCGIVYDRKREQFYLSVRPSDSQEDAGAMDAPGGVLNPDAPEKADPVLTSAGRLEKKLGLKDVEPKVMGIVRIFDEHYSLYNVMTYTEVDDKEPSAKDGTWAKIDLSKVEEVLTSGKITAPAKASLLMALGREEFEKNGWGRERVEEIMNSQNE